MKLSANRIEIFFILLLLLCCLEAQAAYTFNQYKQEMETIVTTIAQKMQQLYQDWCPDGEATCESLSYNGCVGVRRKQCDEQFPKPVACFTGGELVSLASSVKFPPHIDYNNLDENDVRFVCTSAKLEQTFKNISQTRNRKFSGMYFGNSHGLFRNYPGQYRGIEDNKCDEYDPRTRPWYTIAASGAKNVVILLDKSSSMRSKQKEVKKIASSFIDTLSISDNVGVITLSDKAQPIGGTQLKLNRVTNQYKKTLKSAISDLEFSYSEETNYEDAFETGLQLVNNTITLGLNGCSQAENIFLLISDGNPTTGSITSSKDLIKKIEQFTLDKNSRMRRIILFVYALGQARNNEYLKNLTCYFNGLVVSSADSSINTTSAAATNLQQFYKYLSVGVRFTQPIWTEPYTDYYTNTEMVTVSMPAYYTNKQTNLTTLFGVAGVDIIMNEFKNYGIRNDDIVLRLIGESACQRNLIDPCALENMRKPNYRCNLENCTLVNHTEPRCAKTPRTQNIYVLDELVRISNKCCGLTNTEFSLIMAGSAVFLVICLLIIWKRKEIMTRICAIRYRRIKRRHLMRLRQDSSSSGSRRSKNSSPGSSLRSPGTGPAVQSVDESQRSLQSVYSI